MTALELAGGIILGFGGLEVVKALVATAYESHKRKSAKQDIMDIMREADGFVDRMHKDLMAERAAEEAKKRRKPATKKAPVKPVAKKAVKPVVKSKSQARRVAATKGGK